MQVEALDEIEVATKLLKDDTGTQIAKYLHNTHAKTHSSYTVDIVQIFRTSKEGEVERFDLREAFHKMFHPSIADK
ncbi:poly [ADP-ribose] polymerase 2-like [Malus sylvestris]|uniref:poly [ADP-ribose] polymerase 2-like n=1 Tax=Malus sylvestris TaxID=3752 RepID=UPI0021ACE99B|nr:poly [ADP-ribose] polymerase 2-like [Malus sylvestris]